MILDGESWMNIRRFRALHDAGVSISEIGRETGHDWKTIKKYLSADGPVTPPVAPPRAGTQPRLIDPFVEVVDAWLGKKITLKASVIHERLVAEHEFTGNYQRVKMYVAEARPRIAAELEGGSDAGGLGGLHRRFATLAGVQAQVDWGEEGGLLAHVGIGKVYSFHLTLSYSRDSFCCFTTSMDMATFFDAHRRAFAHFGGVPAQLVYDRTKTVVKRHVSPGEAVPIHPEAAAFAAHYGFGIDVLAAHRPTGKGRVERDVAIVRDHVIAGRDFDSVAEIDAAWVDWQVIRRAQVHRTHGEVIAVRGALDRAALLALPDTPYEVCDRHLRRVGKDCLVNFEASLYSVPARRVHAGQRVELRVAPAAVAIHAVSADAGADPSLLATHPRAKCRGQWQVDPAHWDGLPDGHTRAVTVDPPPPAPRFSGTAEPEHNPLDALLARSAAASVPVGRRALSDYETASGLAGRR